MFKELTGEIGREVKAVFIQKTGILMVVVIDAICAGWLGELGSFGRVSAAFALMGVIAEPWGKVAATEGALALRGDRARAARLFGAYAIDPTYIVILASAFVAVQTGYVAAWLGNEASAYLWWALVAKAVGHLPMAGVKALRKSGNTRDIISSTWILSVTNCIGNALSIWYGWGMEGLAASWAVAEVLAAWIPLSRAHRRGLLAMPTWSDLRHIAVRTPKLYKAAVPGAAVCLLRTVVYAVTPAAVLAPFVAAEQGYIAANNLSSQLAKVGVAAVQRGVAGAALAYKWSVYVRIGAAPIALYIGGLPALAMIVLGHFALFAYCDKEEVADYGGHASAGAKADIVWACLIGVALAAGAGGVWWLFAARYAQQLTYYLFAR
jgi:hypothetical protein